jgi:hypothetical protein
MRHRSRIVRRSPCRFLEHTAGSDEPFGVASDVQNPHVESTATIGLGPNAKDTHDDDAILKVLSCDGKEMFAFDASEVVSVRINGKEIRLPLD